MENKELIGFDIARGDATHLSKQIKELASQGYIPQGGIAMCLDADGIMIYAQAFVKYKTK